jgi:hypothetical protein
MQKRQHVCELRNMHATYWEIIQICDKSSSQGLQGALAAASPTGPAQTARLYARTPDCRDVERARAINI